MAYSTNDKGEIVLTLSPDDFERLLLAIGAAQMEASRHSLEASRQSWGLLTVDKINGLLNRMLDGDPSYTPYEVSERERTDPYGARKQLRSSAPTT